MRESCAVGALEAVEVDKELGVVEVVVAVGVAVVVAAEVEGWRNPG